MVSLISRRVLAANRGYIVFWIMLLNDEPTNVLINLFVTIHRLYINCALKEQHSLKRKKLFINDQQMTANSAIKNKKVR